MQKVESDLEENGKLREGVGYEERDKEKEESRLKWTPFHLIRSCQSRRTSEGQSKALCGYRQYRAWVGRTVLESQLDLSGQPPDTEGQGWQGCWLGEVTHRFLRGICEAQQWAEAKATQLCAECGLELLEGSLAQPPLLLLLLPLILLSF